MQGRVSIRTKHHLKKERSPRAKYWYRIIGRTLYWGFVLTVIGLICLGLHYSFQADFGQCSAYDIKCN
ncbi:hypothetical protein KR044_012921 [Drosophila immigrans]|nr:hypothetical protein KR044_012921 [Drosophila immigrans]